MAGLLADLPLLLIQPRLLSVYFLDLAATFVLCNCYRSCLWVRLIGLHDICHLTGASVFAQIICKQLFGSCAVCDAVHCIHDQS